jgi:hypothetical protein
MKNNTPFSSDRNPDLTRTILDVVNEAHNNTTWGDKEIAWNSDSVHHAGWTKPMSEQAIAKALSGAKKTKVAGKTQFSVVAGDGANPSTILVWEDRNSQWSVGCYNKFAAGHGYQKHVAAAKAWMRKAGLVLTNTAPKKGVQEDFDTADEYTELLESVLLALCEELELDPNELVEAMRLTPKRSAVLDREEKKSVKTMIAGNKTALKDKDRKKFNHANARYERIRAIRRGSTGAGSLPGANQKWAPGDERNARAETPKERHEIGAIEREHRTGRTKSTKAHPRRTDK